MYNKQKKTQKIITKTKADEQCKGKAKARQRRRLSKRTAAITLSAKKQ